jgi:hypothetical protein
MALHGRSSRRPSEWVCRAFEQLGSSASKPGGGEIKENMLPPMHAALLNGVVQFHTETWLEVIASIRCRSKSRISIAVGRVLLDRRHQLSAVSML